MDDASGNQISKGAFLYLIVRCHNAVRGDYPSSFYNFYDNFQEFSRELESLGFVMIREEFSDEVGMITPAGYECIRSEEYFTADQIKKMDKLFRYVD
jgi:hypothetical protein